MWPRSKRVYISNFAGLGNRLETLVLAAMIEGQFGHRIVLDWPERTSLRISGTTSGRILPWLRLGAKKVRDFGESEFASLGEHSRIILRATYGPEERQQQYLLPTAARLSPSQEILRSILDAVDPIRTRPLVGVHIRHGDFRLPAGDSYDARDNRHPAVPLWWYEHVMSMFKERFPDVCFLLCFSGDNAIMHNLRKQFHIVMPEKLEGYRPLLAGHVSAGHPVSDLFALACCTTLIASPTSSFSHWAANMLGPETHCILPPPIVSRSQPAQNAVRLYGQILRNWRAAAESGTYCSRVATGDELPTPRPAQLDWLIDRVRDV
jgi:Glycosyl transferase family 11